MNTQLKIQGMTCGHCAASVKTALKSVPGVQSAEVRLVEGKASIVGTAELRALIGAIQEEGYSVSNLASTPDSPATLSDQKIPGQPEGA